MTDRSVRCAAAPRLRAVRVAVALGGALGVVVLGGCAGPAGPTAHDAALAQRAYARNETIRSVSDALDRRLDAMLPVRMADR